MRLLLFEPIENLRRMNLVHQNVESISPCVRTEQLDITVLARELFCSTYSIRTFFYSEYKVQSLISLIRKKGHDMLISILVFTIINILSEDDNYMISVWENHHNYMYKLYQKGEYTSLVCRFIISLKNLCFFFLIFG